MTVDEKNWYPYFYWKFVIGKKYSTISELQIMWDVFFLNFSSTSSLNLSDLNQLNL